MPWKPSTGGPAIRDARLDPFRGHVACLVDGDGACQALVVFETQQWFTCTSGHLWWRRWSPAQEAVHGYMEFRNGQCDDWISTGDELTTDLEDWNRGHFRWRGRLLGLRWLPQEEQAARRHAFWDGETPTD